jgi:endonuclease/exonuclease/phosphatase family metal-dependent hydrolase
VHSPLPALIAAVALLGACFAACAAPEPTGGDGEAVVIEVMSFNLRWAPDPEPNDWSTRQELVLELLRAEAPAVVGLQESRTEYLDALLPQLPQYAAYPTAGKRQNTILYCKRRFRLDATTSDADNARVDAPAADWGQGSVRLPRSARLVDERSGLGFYVYNNHFDHRFVASRLWSARVLIDRIRERSFDDPVILTGDFNAQSDDPALAVLRGKSPTGGPEGEGDRPLRFVDTFRQLHPAATAVGTYHDFLGIRFGRRIDYVLAGPGIRVRSARILRFGRDGRYPSDHFPVAATLLLEVTDASATPSSPNVKAADDLDPRAAAQIASGGCPFGVSP